MQRASKLLEPKSSQLNMFILVEKKQKDPEDDDYDPLIPHYYAPLLDDCASIYPTIKVIVSVSVLLKTPINLFSFTLAYSKPN